MQYLQNLNIHLCGNYSCLYHVPELADGGVHIFRVDDFLFFRECNRVDVALALSWLINISDSNHRDLSIMSSVILSQVLSERERERESLMF